MQLGGNQALMKTSMIFPELLTLLTSKPKYEHQSVATGRG